MHHLEFGLAASNFLGTRVSIFVDVSSFCYTMSVCVTYLSQEIWVFQGMDTKTVEGGTQL